MITFDEALEQITILYEEAKRLHGSDLNEAFKKNRKEFWGNVHKWDLETLIDSAAVDTRIFDIVMQAISNILEDEKPLCTSSRKWLVGFLRGEVKRPLEIAGRKHTFGRWHKRVVFT